MFDILKKKNQKGFTLIELLVVIAIIGILASIVLVSLNSARMKARNANRKADLRSIQLAQEMCYDDSSCEAKTEYADDQGDLTGANYLPVELGDPTAGGQYHCDNGGAAPVVCPNGVISTDATGATWEVCAELEPTASGGVFICDENGCREEAEAANANCD